MLSMEQQAFLCLSAGNRLRIHTNNHGGLLSFINLLRKTITVTGMLITILSNHRAKNSHGYAGYKNRCVVHTCISINPDPAWLIDLICLLSTTNLLMELMIIVVKLSSWSRKIDLLLGFMFVVTCIVADCGIVFAIYSTSYAYQLSMGYAYYCFMLTVFASIVDWAFSLKRFISDWPEMILLNPHELSYYTNQATSIP